jgi:hypothetical protein
MGNVATNLHTDLQYMQCGTCGVWHALPKIMYDKCCEEGGFWHCPNGHQRGYDKGSVYKKLEAAQAELAAEKQRKNDALERANASALRADVAERSIKTLKRRVGAGVCPCCTRTFQNLARHMKTKHPKE